MFQQLFSGSSGADEVPPCRSPRLSPPTRPGRRRVFVVDDEHIIAETLAEILNLNGYHATAFYCAEDALEGLHSGCPEIFITDVMLLGMNGVEAAVQLRRKCPGTRTLLFSGQAEASEVLRKAQESGYNFEILAKPIRPEALLRRLLQEPAG